MKEKAIARNSLTTWGRVTRELEADPSQLIRLEAEIDTVCENCPNN
jgi:hypothetical protein